MVKIASRVLWVWCVLSFLPAALYAAEPVKAKEKQSLPGYSIQDLEAQRAAAENRIQSVGELAGMNWQQDEIDWSRLPANFAYQNGEGQSVKKTGNTIRFRGKNTSGQIVTIAMEVTDIEKLMVTNEGTGEATAIKVEPDFGPYDVGPYFNYLKQAKVITTAVYSSQTTASAKQNLAKVGENLGQKIETYLGALLGEGYYPTVFILSEQKGTRYRYLLNSSAHLGGHSWAIYDLKKPNQINVLTGGITGRMTLESPDFFPILDELIQTANALAKQSGTTASQANHLKQMARGMENFINQHRRRLVQNFHVASVINGRTFIVTHRSYALSDRDVDLISVFSVDNEGRNRVDYELDLVTGTITDRSNDIRRDIQQGTAEWQRIMVQMTGMVQTLSRSTDLRSYQRYFVLQMLSALRKKMDL